jgi:prepilin-type N-terminal cleavage/methylation domain-containing protein
MNEPRDGRKAMNAKQVIRGQWSTNREHRKANDDRFCDRPFILHPSYFILRRRGFTLVELMVTITIIGIIAGMSLAAMQYARRFAAEEKTKATIAKLDAIITRKMEEYKTRRVTLPTSYLQTQTAFYNYTTPGDPTNARKAMQDYQWARLDILRDTMRQEIPDCAWDITTGPQQLIQIQRSPVSWTKESLQEAFTRETSLHKMYRSRGVWTDPNGNQSYDPAQCLYLVVSSKAEDIEQFSQNEIGTVGPNGNRVFVDGWGKPIMFLRWAPGFIPANGADTIQIGNPTDDHDPFDTRKVDPSAYSLTPLIYSAGPDGEYGLYLGSAQLGFVYPNPANWGGHIRTCEPVGSIPLIGTPDPNAAIKTHHDNITNHQIEMK